MWSSEREVFQEEQTYYKKANRIRDTERLIKMRTFDQAVWKFLEALTKIVLMSWWDGW